MAVELLAAVVKLRQNLAGVAVFAALWPELKEINLGTYGVGRAFLASRKSRASSTSENFPAQFLWPQ